MIRIYLDTCCLSRPHDDQKQERVRLESEAIFRLLAQVDRKECALIGSDAVDAEIAAIRDPERRRKTQGAAAASGGHVGVDEDRLRRGRLLESLGLGVYDSLHIACAEAAGADALLTTDDALIRRARRLQHQVGVRVMNPVTWVKEQMG
jgi:predicted nucleic acid-binding protein